MSRFSGVGTFKGSRIAKRESHHDFSLKYRISISSGLGGISEWISSGSSRALAQSKMMTWRSHSERNRAISNSVSQLIELGLWDLTFSFRGVPVWDLQWRLGLDDRGERIGERHGSGDCQHLGLASWSRTDSWKLKRAQAVTALVLSHFQFGTRGGFWMVVDGERRNKPRAWAIRQIGRAHV